ncbi:MAG: TonB-dependent receptor [Pyrinomonadaceae bacterium]|nr:TonB-dependent receptor [Pyrinomonadaceae bacterium]
MAKNLLSNSIKFLVLSVFCFVLSVAHTSAQSTVSGGIRGNVTDPQGAAVANATVKITNTGTNKADTATSDSDGNFRFNNLQPGIYSLSVTSSGFAEFKKEQIIVEVGQFTTINPTMALVGQQASVEVTAEAPIVNTNDNANTNNFNQTSINELPINGRRWSNFAILSPSAVPDGTFGLISFRGISGLLNNNTIDGGDNNQAFFSEERGRTRINYVISQAAIREFQVNTSNYSAEYGRSAGGVTNAVTKSGTNNIHGEAFYYIRNNRWGARNPRAFQSVLNNGVADVIAAKPRDLRQQFGATIGGPIKKDKLFYFFSYDQQKRNFPGLAVFTNPGYLNTVSTATLTGKGLTTTQINDTLTFINSLTGETPRKGDQLLLLPKIDWIINDKHSLAVSYNRLRWDSPAGIQTQAVNTFARRSFGDDFVDVDSVNARLTSTLSQNMLNEARFQYGRDFEYEFSQEPLPGEPTTATTSQGARPPQITLTNGLQFGTANFLERAKYPDERRIQFADSLTWTRGNHTFKFGGDFNHVTDDLDNLRTQAGQYTYSNINDFIIDYVNWKTPLNAATVCSTSTRTVGRCYTSSYAQGIGILGTKFSTNEYNFFGQDDWRVTPRVTVNLGLRWEYQQMPKAFLANTSTALIPSINRTVAEATSYMPSDKNNFGPRIGFAYSLTEDGKTSLRGGYGIYYGRIQNSTISNALINTGNSGGQAQLSISQTSACAPIFPAVLTPACATFSAGAIQFFQKDFQAPLIHQYDLVFEREVMKNTTFSFSYVGSSGYNLPIFYDRNLAQNTTTPTNTFTIYGGPLNGTVFTLPNYYSTGTTTNRPVAGFAQLTEIRSSVKSQYDGAVFQLNRRFTDGLQFNVSYTLAKAYDTGQTSQTFTANNTPFDPFDSSYERGASRFDVRHKFVANAVYAPKLYKGDSEAAKQLLNGWSFAPILAIYSGQPFTSFVSGTGLNGSQGSSRFPLEPNNNYRLPKLVNLDARLSKRFAFSEKYKLEFLAEVFNVANRTQVFQKNNTLYTRSTNCATINGITTNNANGLCYGTTFGQITTTDSTLYRERQIQLSTRFQF